MSMDQKNLNLSKEDSNYLYDIVQEKSPLYPIYIEKLENENNYIIESNEAKCFMHSIYNIENEMDMMFKKIPKDVTTIILFGIGNGKAIEYINKHYTRLSEIIIIEPSLQIFNNYLRNNNAFEGIKSYLDITLIVNKDEVTASELISNRLFKVNQAFFVSHISYCSVFTSYYQKILSETGKALKIKRGSIQAVSGQWKPWLVNSIKNLQEDAIPIESLEEIFKDRTAILVSAGPSLNKNMHLIPKLKEKGIVVAVGSAIKILDSNGIEPHFRVAIDGLPREKIFLEGIDTEKVPLIFGNQLYYEILPEYKGSKIRMTLESDQIGKYVCTRMDIPYKKISSGTSVANGTLDFMCRFGVKRVVFMGQDLSYTEKEFHAKGTNTTGKEHTFINLNDYIETQNIYGEKVYTIDPFLQVKYRLEDIIRGYEDIKFINATEGGLGIDGAINLPLQEILDIHLKDIKNIELEKEFHKIDDTEILEGYSCKIRDGIEIIRKELIEIRKIHNEIMKYLMRLRKLKQKNISMNRIFNELSYIETLEKRMEEIPSYEDLVLETIRVDLIAIKSNFQYKGDDRRKEMESSEKIITNKMVKVKEYIDFAMILLENKDIKIEFQQDEEVK